jgi:hypothetical protein
MVAFAIDLRAMLTYYISMADAKKKDVDKEEKRPVGRPTDYSHELAAKICSKLAHGQSVRTICRVDGMPNPDTIYEWLRVHKEFAEQYAKAKDDGCDAMFDDLLAIADDGENDYMETFDDDGKPTGYKFCGEHFQRSRLRVDTRKWYLSKLKPKKYGDKLELGGGTSDTTRIIYLPQKKPKGSPVDASIRRPISNSGTAKHT